MILSRVRRRLIAFVVFFIILVVVTTAATHDVAAVAVDSSGRKRVARALCSRDDCGDVRNAPFLFLAALATASVGADCQVLEGRALTALSTCLA